MTANVKSKSGPHKTNTSDTEHINKNIFSKTDSISNFLIFPGPSPDDPTTSADTNIHHSRQTVPTSTQNASTHQIVMNCYGYEDYARLGLPGDCGVAPDGVAPSGVAPGGVAPSGVTPGGVAPGGVAPGGVVYAAAHAACGGRQGGDAGVCSGGDRVASNIIISQCIADCCVPMA